MYGCELGNILYSGGFWISSLPAVGASSNSGPILQLVTGADTTKSMEKWKWGDLMKASTQLKTEMRITDDRIHLNVASQAHMFALLTYLNNFYHVFSYWNREHSVVG